MYPGWQAIEFRETINHNGAPYRLALSFNDDDNFNTHVLLDQIPHNDEGRHIVTEGVIYVCVCLKAQQVEAARCTACGYFSKPVFVLC